MSSRSQQEVVLSSSSSSDDQLYLWDLHSGAVLATYKTGQSGGVGRHGVAFSFPMVFMAASNDRPVLNAWYWQKDQVHLKSTVAEKVPVIAISPDGQYLIGGSSLGKIFTWELSTGNLLRITEAHYKSISVIKFTDDGCFVMVGADDAMVSVWRLLVLISPASSQELAALPTPEHSLSEHSLPITDIHVGIGGVNTRMVTSSLDRTCKIWEVASGLLLCSVVFPAQITSVVMDACELTLFAGGSDGKIYRTYLHEQSAALMRDVHQQQQQHSQRFFGLSGNSDSFFGHDDTNIFSGHRSAISCLSLSFDGNTLVSGSDDATVIVWDTASRQIMKTFNQHKSTVSNVAVFFKPPELLSLTTKKILPPLSPIKRFLVSGSDEATMYPVRIREVGVEHAVAARILAPSFSTMHEHSRELVSVSLSTLDYASGSSDAVAEAERLKEEIENLKAQNAEWQQVSQKLHNFVANDLVQNQ